MGLKQSAYADGDFMVNIWFESGGVSQEAVEEQIQFFGEEIIPVLHASAAARHSSPIALFSWCPTASARCQRSYQRLISRRLDVSSGLTRPRVRHAHPVNQVGVHPAELFRRSPAVRPVPAGNVDAE